MTIITMQIPYRIRLLVRVHSRTTTKTVQAKLSMNLSQEAGDSTSELLFVNFNQDATSLSVGTKLGYKLFPLTTIERKLDPSFEKEGGEICIIERLFSSSLVAIVELAHPRKLRACHFKKNSEICTYSYPDIILAVKLNRQRLVVVLKQNLYIHNIRDMKVMHTIRDTPKNPAGLCALSVDNEGGFLAYPGNSQNGEVQVFDAINLKAVAAIPAHESPLAALAFNISGNKLATASTTGTVIRVFSIPSGEKVFEFRRGMKRFIHINCLSFSPDDFYLATSSSTETVHIFKLIQPARERAPDEQQQQQGWMSYIGKAIGSTASYLGSDALSMNRAFAHMKLPKPGLRSVCTVAVIDGAHRILVATSEGRLYIGGINPREGGDCRILKEFSLIGDPVDEEDGAIASASGGLQTYASVASHAPPTDHTHQGSPDSHMTQHRDSHGQNLAEDDKPPSTHTVHS